MELVCLFNTWVSNRKQSKWLWRGCLLWCLSYNQFDGIKICSPLRPTNELLYSSQENPWHRERTKTCIYISFLNWILEKRIFHEFPDMWPVKNTSFYLLFVEYWKFSVCVVKKIKLVTVIEGDQKALFSIATTPRYKEGATPFPRLHHLIFDTYLILLSVKQGGIKYHF